MFNFLRTVLFCISFAISSIAYAATDAEIHWILNGVKAERLFKTSIVEINAYQLGKHQAGSDAARMESRREFSALVEKQLSWPSIEPLVLKVYTGAITSSDAVTLASFLRSEASKPYVDGYLPSAASMAIALDQFIDRTVDRLIDDPDLPLERVEKLLPQESIAARLVQTLRSPKATAEFAAQRKAWLASMDTMLQPKTKDKKALQRHSQKMSELGRVFSEEQVTWQMARVLSQRMPAAQVEQLLAELGNPALLTALHKLGEAGKNAEALVARQLMDDPAISEWINKTVSAAK